MFEALLSVNEQVFEPLSATLNEFPLMLQLVEAIYHLFCVVVEISTQLHCGSKEFPVQELKSSENKTV
ncbi:hypothetical protein DSECCO2_636620 [anaerobic digester metagenome]